MLPAQTVPGEEIVIGPDFKEGQSIPQELREQITEKVPALKESLEKSTLHHASAAEFEKTKAAWGGIDIAAWADGTRIMVPPGKGLSLETITHEATHVRQYLANPKYFRANYQRAVERARATAPKGLTQEQLSRWMHDQNRYEGEAIINEQKLRW
jgi:hypothetical protein